MNEKMSTTEKASIDKETFGEYIIEHSESLQRFIYTLTGDNYSKDEILQNTIIRAYKSIDNLREPEKFYPWIMQIAKTETIRFHHSEKKWKIFSEYEDGMPAVLDYNDSSFNALASKELKEEFWKVIDSLKKEHAQILILHFNYDMSLKDVAKALGKNYNTIKSQYRRGIQEAKESYFKLTGNKEDNPWAIIK